MMLFCLLLVFSCTILIDANAHKSEVGNACNIGAFCEAKNELHQPHEVLWSGHSSSITLQVKAADLKNGKTGRIYHTVRTPTKFVDRQVKKRSTVARRSMKRGAAVADKKVRSGTNMAHQLARRGIILLDKQFVRGSKMAHDYLARTSKSLDNKIVAGTRKTHSSVKHTIIPIDKGIVHGSSRAYATAKKGVTAVDRRIKNSVRAVDQQLASGNMKGVPLTVPVKFFLSSVFKSKGKKEKGTPTIAATAAEPESAPPAEMMEVAQSVTEELPHSESESEIKAPASAESVKYSMEGADEHEGHSLDDSSNHHEEKAHEREASAESLNDDTMSDFDMDDKFEDAKHEDHDHGHDHVTEDHSHSQLEDDGHNHLDSPGSDHDANFEDIDQLDEADNFDEHNHHSNDLKDDDDYQDHFEDLDHDHEKETNVHDAHHTESANFDGEPRNVKANKTKKRSYFQNKIKQAVPRASSKMKSVYNKAGLPKSLSRSLTKSRLPKNLSRSLTKISRPSSQSLSKLVGKSSRSLSRSTKKSSQLMSKGVGKPSQSLSSSVGTRSLTKLKGVKAFSKKNIPKSLSKFRASLAPKSRI